MSDHQQRTKLEMMTKLLKQRTYLDKLAIDISEYPLETVLDLQETFQIFDTLHSCADEIGQVINALHRLDQEEIMGTAKSLS